MHRNVYLSVTVWGFNPFLPSAFNTSELLVPFFQQEQNLVVLRGPAGTCHSWCCGQFGDALMLIF